MITRHQFMGQLLMRNEDGRRSLFAVAACAVPEPAGAPACIDRGAVSRAAPAVFFYQLRAYCDRNTEGP